MIVSVKINCKVFTVQYDDCFSENKLQSLHSTLRGLKLPVTAKFTQYRYRNCISQNKLQIIYSQINTVPNNKRKGNLRDKTKKRRENIPLK